MVHNAGITQIGDYQPIKNNNNYNPMITRAPGAGSASDSFPTYGAYVGVTGAKSQYSRVGIMPIGIGGGWVEPLIEMSIPEPSTITNLPSYGSVFLGYTNGYWVAKGDGQSQSSGYYFKMSDISGTLKTFAHTTTLGKTYFGEALLDGKLYSWGQQLTTSESAYINIQVQKITDTGLETTRYNNVHVVSYTGRLDYLRLAHVFSDGKLLFIKAAGDYATYPRFVAFIADLETKEMYPITGFKEALIDSGFLEDPTTLPSDSPYSQIYCDLVAVTETDIWIRSSYRYKATTKPPVERLCNVRIASTADADTFYLSAGIYWGLYSRDELYGYSEFGNKGTEYRRLYIPVMGGFVKHVYGAGPIYNATAPWAVTAITVGPVDPAPPQPSDDPYQEEGGISDYGGGGGGIDMTESDDVDFPTPPSNMIADCGLISFYNPTKQEIINLADQIMSQSIAGAIKNIFTDPLEGIVSLALFNGSPPLSGSRGEIKVGLIGTGVTANLLSSSYMTLDCGSITVGDKTKGNALDFSPYTTAQLYLPFIGFASVSPDDFMYGTVHIKYNIDLLSGSCVALVRIQKDDKNDLLYTYSGNVLTSIPLNGKNYKEIIKATATITAAVAVGGVAGGIATGAATGALSSAAKAGFVESMEQFQTAGVSAATKPSITRSGRLDMSIGAMSPKKPYLVFSRPAQSLPEKFKSYRGYPSNVTTKLSELVGYTEVQDVHLTGIPATTEELDLIMEHLKGGIII